MAPSIMAPQTIAILKKTDFAGQYFEKPMIPNRFL